MTVGGTSVVRGRTSPTVLETASQAGRAESAPPSRLIRFFASQMERLERLRVADELLNLFTKNMKKVLLEVRRCQPEEGSLPFMPVIPLARMDTTALLSLVRGAGGARLYHTALNRQNLHHFSSMPQTCYFLCHVARGEGGCNLESSSEIDQPLLMPPGVRRQRLTVAEILALAIHDENWFTDGPLYATGDKYHKSLLPRLWRDDAGVVHLDSQTVSQVRQLKQLASPSCGRIVLCDI